MFVSVGAQINNNNNNIYLNTCLKKLLRMTKCKEDSILTNSNIGR